MPFLPPSQQRQSTYGKGTVANGCELLRVVVAETVVDWFVFDSGGWVRVLRSVDRRMQAV